MYEKIIITGTPGTGKTLVANALGELLKTRVIHINEYAKEHNLVIGEEDGSLVIDMLPLRELLNKEMGIIEGHLACEFKLRNSFVIVLRCDPKILKKRLQTRGYSPKKIKENLEVEALDYCTQMAEKSYRAVFEIDTTKRTVSNIVDEAMSIIYGRSKGDKVDYSRYLGKDLGERAQALVKRTAKVPKKKKKKRY